MQSKMHCIDIKQILNTKTMTTQEKLVRVKTLMFGLSFDHQRMSSSGQQYFEEICKLLDIKL